MEIAELRDALVDLAREAGLEVRAARARSGSDFTPPASGTCRVRGAVWVVLSPGDPLDVQVEVLGHALRDHAGAFVESRYLPPAVRACLASPEGPDSESSHSPRGERGEAKPDRAARIPGPSRGEQR